MRIALTGLLVLINGVLGGILYYSAWMSIGVGIFSLPAISFYTIMAIIAVGWTISGETPILNSLFTFLAMKSSATFWETLEEMMKIFFRGLALYGMTAVIIFVLAHLAGSTWQPMIGNWRFF